MFAYGMMAILTSLLCLIIIKLPGIISYIGTIIWGAGLIICASHLKSWQYLSILLLNVVLFLILAASNELFIYLSFFGISAMAMSCLASFDMNYYFIQKIGAVSVILGVSLFLWFLLLTNGTLGIKDMEISLSSYMEQSFAVYEAEGLTDIYEQAGIPPEVIKEYLTKTAQNVARHLPAFYYLQALTSAFVMLLLATYVIQKYKIGNLRKEPFYKEILPWQSVGAVILGLTFCLLDYTDKSALFYTGSNILAFMIPVAVYYGLAAFVYKTKQQLLNLKSLIIIVSVILTLTFPLLVVVFLAAIGIFDSLLDYRKIQDTDI